jgi:hypothetical protein
MGGVQQRRGEKIVRGGRGNLPLFEVTVLLLQIIAREELVVRARKLEIAPHPQIVD